MSKQGKLLIFSAPSGSGKTTIVRHLLENLPDLEFSISATSRLSRPNEKHGVDYFFLTPEEFREKIANDEFLEWEEVYSGVYYGTLKSEIDRIRTKGKHVVFDVDVVGGIDIKKQYGDDALAVFIKPPSLEELSKRLQLRSTETAETLQKRLEKAEWELSFATEFDTILVNDKLEQVLKEAKEVVQDHVGCQRQVKNEK